MSGSKIDAWFGIASEDGVGDGVGDMDWNWGWNWAGTGQAVVQSRRTVVADLDEDEEDRHDSCCTDHRSPETVLRNIQRYCCTDGMVRTACCSACGWY